MTKCCAACSTDLSRKNNLSLLKGKTFGSLEVVGMVDNNIYKCKCSCGNIIRVPLIKLRTGEIKRCKSCEDKLKNNELIINIGDKFDELEVIDKLENNMYLCKCSCGREYAATEYELLNSIIKSCHYCSSKTNQSIYNDKLNKKKSGAYKETEAMQDKTLIKGLASDMETRLGRKPTSLELSYRLAIDVHTLNEMIKDYRNEIYTKSDSLWQLELKELLKNNLVIYGADEVVPGYTLDAYIPDKKIALSFNDTYNHSDEARDKKYHQNISIACATQGIYLIHIFEYEWNDAEKHDKLVELLNFKLGNTVTKRVYARETQLVTPTTVELREFLENYHLQGYSSSKVNYGLKYNNELVAVMTFGVPRFNYDYEYELVRLTFKPGYNIVGGAQKMFSHFIDEHNPKSIISYCNISKFDGRVYPKLGFTAQTDDVLAPNYMWVNPQLNEALPRYKCMKHKLLAKGLGNPQMTEDEIMKSIGYFKVYDSGNLKFSWYKQ
jgi:hypothetical protein